MEAWILRRCGAAFKANNGNPSPYKLHTITVCANRHAGACCRRRRDELWAPRTLSVESVKQTVDTMRQRKGTQHARSGTDRGKSTLTEHRRSYWKTAVSTALLVLVGFAAIVWLLVERRMAQEPRSPLVLLLWSAGFLLLLCGELVTVLALAGAIISLHRDYLEAHGTPYAGRPREWHGGFAVQRFRALLRVLSALRGRRHGRLDLRAGELVEILSREEILATLDCRGELDSLPFMPEMEAWCGERARVHRRVEKIFDWITASGLRRMRDTVILEGLRCDGSSHGGCQADCPFLWKEAWLRRASAKGINSVAQ